MGWKHWWSHSVCGTAPHSMRVMSCCLPCQYAWLTLSAYIPSYSAPFPSPLSASTLVQILFWDTTSGNKPVCAIRSAHGSGPDVHCVDWSGLQEHLIVTGV